MNQIDHKKLHTKSGMTFESICLQLTGSKSPSPTLVSQKLREYLLKSSTQIDKKIKIILLFLSRLSSIPLDLGTFILDYINPLPYNDSIKKILVLVATKCHVKTSSNKYFCALNSYKLYLHKQEYTNLVIQSIPIPELIESNQLEGLEIDDPFYYSLLQDKIKRDKRLDLVYMLNGKNKGNKRSKSSCKILESLCERIDASGLIEWSTCDVSCDASSLELYCSTLQEKMKHPPNSDTCLLISLISDLEGKRFEFI